MRCGEATAVVPSSCSKQCIICGAAVLQHGLPSLHVHVDACMFPSTDGRHTKCPTIPQAPRRMRSNLEGIEVVRANEGLMKPVLSAAKPETPELSESAQLSDSDGFRIILIELY